MKLKARQIAYAGTLYRHAVVATMDWGGTETDDEAAVVVHAIEGARRALESLGHSISDCITLNACIQIAGRRHHGKPKS